MKKKEKEEERLGRKVQVGADLVSAQTNNRRTGVPPVYSNVGVRFIEPVLGRINPTPTLKKIF